MLELRTSTGALDFSRVTPEMVSEMPEAHQEALLTLIAAHDARELALSRRNNSVQRLALAVENEKITLEARELANSPIPLSTAAIEEQLQRPLNASELAAAKSAHSIRVQALKDLQARRASVDSYNSNH